MRTGRRPPSLKEASFSGKNEPGGTVGRRIRVLLSVVMHVMKWLKIPNANVRDGSSFCCWASELEAAPEEHAAPNESGGQDYDPQSRTVSASDYNPQPRKSKRGLHDQDTSGHRREIPNANELNARCAST
jgi:hypothetical protein